jgi:hypothetical protein
VASLVPFTIDLTAHEGTRLAAVLDALGTTGIPTTPPPPMSCAAERRLQAARLAGDTAALHQLLDDRVLFTSSSPPTPATRSQLDPNLDALW